MSPRKKSRLRDVALTIIVVAIVIGGAVLYDTKKTNECEAKGGVYVTHDDLCIKKEAIIK